MDITKAKGIAVLSGHLGSDLTNLVESGASIEEWNKVITSESSERKIRAKEIYWGKIFSY